MKIYISGKITGTTDYEKRFAKATDKFRNKGYYTVNPVEVCSHIKEGSAWETYMRECIKALCDCTHIYMMHGWHDSKGAIEELKIAKMLGLKIHFEGVGNL